MKTAPSMFVNIETISQITGLTVWFFRKNIDEIPHLKSGNKFMFNPEQVTQFLLAKSYGNSIHGQEGQKRNNS